MKVPHLDQPALMAMLHYDPETGIFIWRHRADARPQWNGRWAGKVAGYAREATGGGLYWSIRIYDWPFHASRLAWLYMTGEWPTGLVDHRDLDGLNNRWVNLREATKAQNGANRLASSNSRTGIKGVSPDGNRYRAAFRGRFLGYRDTIEEAEQLYLAAAEAHFGEFARGST